MSTVTVRLNTDEQKLFTEYAKMHDMPLSTLLKNALEERIEDEIDLKLIRDFENSPDYYDEEYLSHEEVSKMVGL
ncbi:hypothetical protein AWM75_00735 [Aerococcus urinaehominis]|uniref:Uncharacterized protein n=1 Tax=Aerococcus urinaehominis TaxID=128944 RepID=A0A0X8FJX3_9LACT|nr:DUF6290 family protein [Aerococcus urinaehominis]AMB98607.1 hypothetical protein AWM75_00735 [Aerococcus urinaehominis]SDL95000.1 hypothetical protein SAMN04487985_1035 [Aerococcus urinaehominis]